MEALQEAYRLISDAPGDTKERVDGRRSGPSPPASPVEQARGDHLPASTNGSGEGDVKINQGAMNDCCFVCM